MKVLALDLDGTTIGTKNYVTPHYLSPAIVQFAKDQNFDCVIFVTKRSSKSFAADIWQYVIRWAVSGLQSQDTVKICYKGVACDIDREYFSSCILGNAAQHFHLATEIPLLTISTEDDVSLDDCGRGYMSYVMPLERKLMSDLKEKKYATLISPENDIVPKKQQGKNTQLQLLARKIARYWPKEEINLTFVDDLFDHCVEAQTAFADNPNVKPTILYFGDNEMLVPIEQELANRQVERSRLFYSAQFFQRAFQEKKTHILYSIKLVGSKHSFETSLEINQVESLYEHFGGIESLVSFIGGNSVLTHVDISLAGNMEGESLREQFNRVEDYLSFIREYLPEKSEIKAVYIRK